jgi:hypothetical protein
MNVRLPSGLLLAMALLGCETLPEAPCAVGVSENAAGYLVQLRPQGMLPSGCPQGQQYQFLVASQYLELGSDAPNSIVFQFLGSSIPDGGSQAFGKFTTLLAPPSSSVCSVETLTPATDDNATPVNVPAEPVPTTYRFSDLQVLSDVAHQGNQFQAKALLDYGIAGCRGLEFVAQAVFPTRNCLNDSICLPEQIATDIKPPAGRGLGSGLSPDYRAFCNLDPALLDNLEVTSLLAGFPFFLSVGRDAYRDPTDGSLHDVGICFFSEPFPSLCPSGSTLSTSGPCVVGPGSNPH